MLFQEFHCRLFVTRAHQLEVEMREDGVQQLSELGLVRVVRLGNPELKQTQQFYFGEAMRRNASLTGSATTVSFWAGKFSSCLRSNLNFLNNSKIELQD